MNRRALLAAAPLFATPMLNAPALAQAPIAMTIATGVDTGNSATVVPRGKQTLQEFSSSFDLPLPSLRLAAGLGMIASMGLMILMMRVFFVM